MSICLPIIIFAGGLLIRLLYKLMVNRYAHLDLPQIMLRLLLLSLAVALPMFYLGLCIWNDALDNPVMQDPLWLTGRDIFFTGFPLTLIVMDYAWSNWDRWWGVASMAVTFLSQWIIWGQLFAVIVYWQGHRKLGLVSSNELRPRHELYSPSKSKGRTPREQRNLLLFAFIAFPVILGVVCGLIILFGN